MAKASTKSSPGAAPTRRDEILEVAARVIAERGIKDATVRDIGEAAGILSGSLYYHFESKEQIIVELLQPSLQANLDAATAICAEQRGLEALAQLIRNAVLSTAANPHRALILRNETRAFSELESLASIAHLRASVMGLWLDVIKEGIASGEIRDDIDPEILVFAMVDGTLGGSRWFSGSRDKQPDVVADGLIHFYVDGAKPPLRAKPSATGTRKRVPKAG